mgnify:CR=1 FL=1
MDICETIKEVRDKRRPRNRSKALIRELHGKCPKCGMKHGDRLNEIANCDVCGMEKDNLSAPIYSVEHDIFFRICLSCRTGKFENMELVEKPERVFKNKYNTSPPQWVRNLVECFGLFYIVIKE